MTLAEALKYFDERNRKGKVPDRRSPGRTHSISAARRDVVFSHVRNAVARAAGVDRKDPSALAGVEVVPLLSTLPEIARQDAKSAGRAAPRNEQANVSLFVATVDGREFEASNRHGFAKRRPVRRDEVLPAWLPLFDALVDDATNPDGSRNSRKSFPAQLLAFQRLVLQEEGIREPYEIPDDFEWFMTMGEAAGLKRKKLHALLAAIRRAREVLDDVRIPSLYQRAAPADRSLNSLPALGARLRSKNVGKDPRTLPQEELIAALAPKFYQALQKRLAQGRRQNRRPTFHDDHVAMTSRIAASLARLGIDPAERTFVDLWTEMVQVEGDAGAGEVDPVLAEVLGEDYVHVETHSLMRRVLDESTRISYQNSPLMVTSQAPVDGDVPLYTDAVMQDAKRAFVLVREVYGPALSKHKKALWNAVESEHRALLAHMESHNEARQATGFQDKARVLILWPQAVCMFLPWLMQRVEERRMKLHRFRQGLGREGSRTHRKHLRALDTALREYVLAALLLDDGLRIKNYAGARVGKELVADVIRGAGGRWVGFEKVESRFRGVRGDHQVLLKMSHERRAERKRERQLTPGILRYDLLFEYWTESRARELVRRGVLESVEEFDADKDRWALFVAPSIGGRRSAKQPRSSFAKEHACYTPDQLSQIFARVFHEFIREQLGRKVPAWDNPIRTKGEWEGLFSAHITRTLIATYWGGIKGDWPMAKHLTNDSMATLQAHYAVVRDRVHELKHRDGIENPGWFDVVIMRALKMKPDDNWAAFWSAFDPEAPTDALDALKEEDPARKGQGNRACRGR